MMLVLHQKCLTQVSDMFLVLIILIKVFISYDYFSPTVSKKSGHAVVLLFSSSGDVFLKKESDRK